MKDVWFCIVMGITHLIIAIVAWIVGGGIGYNPLLVSNLWLIAAVLVEQKK